MSFESSICNQIRSVTSVARKNQGANQKVEFEAEIVHSFVISEQPRVPRNIIDKRMP